MTTQLGDFLSADDEDTRATVTKDGWVRWVPVMEPKASARSNWAEAYHRQTGKEYEEDYPLTRYKRPDGKDVVFIVRAVASTEWYLVHWDYRKYDKVHVIAGPIDDLEIAKVAAELI